MSKIDDYELKIRRQKLISQYQHCQAYIDNMNSGNFDKSHMASAAVTGQIAGRVVTQINSTGSKEAQLYRNYLISTVEDQLRSHYVNTVKNTETRAFK
jgi:hypothetical protein